MLRDLVQFLKHDKLYTVLLIFVIVTYAFVFFGKGKEEEGPSEAAQMIREAETVLQERLEAGEPLVGGVVPQSRSLSLLSFLTLLLIAGTLVGLVLDIKSLVRGATTRPGEEVPIRGPSGSWDVIDCVRVIILFMAFGILLSIGLGILRRIFGSETENTLLILHTTFVDIAAVFFILAIISRYGNGIKELGLKFGNFMQNVFAGVAGYIKILPLFIGMLILVMIVVKLFNLEPPPHPIVDVFVEEEKRNPLLVAYTIVLACVIGPIIEEIFFRGFCYTAIKQRWGAPLSMIITALFFAGIHWSPFAFFPVFILGLGLAYVYEKNNTLIPSIVMHVVHNSFFIGYFFLIKSALIDKVV